MKQIIFLAAIWGILEATLGWFFHIIRFPSGAVMFPIGMVILLAGYTIKHERSSLLLIGAITAAIKLSNFILPGKEFVFNPTMSILIESLIIAYIAPYINVNWSDLKVSFLKADYSYATSFIMLALAIVIQIAL